MTDPLPSPSPPDPQAASRNALRELVVLCLDRMEEEGAEALEDLCRLHPEHEGALRARIARLESGGWLEGASAVDPPPRELGDFTLLEKIGSGGMGVVYRARQRSLGRIVALKLIRPDQLVFDEVRERFRREVELVSRLSHRGIIPVHLVGEEGDLPYFAMEFVRGATLAELLLPLLHRPFPRKGGDLARVLSEKILERSEGEPGRLRSMASSSLFRGTFVETCVRIVREVADALHHAHEHGITHRDVKPSNVMLTEDGRVLLLDFGLASSSSDSKLTRSGMQVGSLAYLPPENLRRKETVSGPGRDVYALGITLYEALTLRAPFDAKTTERTLSAIVRGQIVSPRQRNREVSRDLEVVCLKAMAPEAENRYATAQAFAADLQRILRHEPVRARSATLPIRARRFAQRHPAWGVTFLFAVLLLMLGPWPFLWLQHRATAEQKELNRELTSAHARARSNLDEAHANLALLRELSSKLLVDIHDQILTVEGSIEARRTLVKLCLHYLERLLEKAADDPRTLEQVAEGYFRAGVVQGSPSYPHLGEFEAALESYGRSQEFRERLIAIEPEEPRHRRELGWTFLYQAAVLREIGRGEEAFGLVERGLRVARELVGKEPSVLDAAFLLQALTDMAQAEYGRGRVEVVDALIEECRSVLDRLPADREQTQWVASVRILIEQIEVQRLLERGEVDGARALLERQLAFAVREYDLHPNDPKRAYDVVDVSRRLSELEAASGDAEGALEHQRRAVDVMRTTWERDPLDLRGRIMFATDLRRLVNLLDPALEETTRVLAEARRVCEGREGETLTILNRQELARVRFDEAKLHERRGEFEEARVAYEEAAEAFSKLAEEDSANSSHARIGSNALSRLALMAENVGNDERRPDRASWYDTAIRSWERASAIDRAIGIDAMKLGSGKTRAQYAKESIARLHEKRESL